MRLAGRCAWCWSIFHWEWTAAQYPQMFCSKNHADKARVASKRIRSTQPPGVCATPHKKPYLTRDAAMGTVREAPTRHLGVIVYECSCGFFHLGHIRKMQEVA